jgi:hypothetical protein
MLAPGLLQMVLDNIAECERELEDENVERCDAMDEDTKESSNSVSVDVREDDFEDDFEDDYETEDDDDFETEDEDNYETEDEDNYETEDEDKKTEDKKTEDKKTEDKKTEDNKCVICGSGEPIVKTVVKDKNGVYVKTSICAQHLDKKDSCISKHFKENENSTKSGGRGSQADIKKKRKKKEKKELK